MKLTLSYWVRRTERLGGVGKEVLITNHLTQAIRELLFPNLRFTRPLEEEERIRIHARDHDVFVIVRDLENVVHTAHGLTLFVVAELNHIPAHGLDGGGGGECYT